MSDYVFELVSSSDLTKIGELTRARGRSLSLTLNRAGSLDFTLPLADPFSPNISEIDTCVVIRRLNQVVWSGPVWTVSESTPDTLSVGCVGWAQTLEKRVSKYTWGNPLPYVSTDAGAIALDLLTRSNADNITGPNYVIPGTAQTTQSRTQSYQPFSNILNEIQALSDLESGYDFLVDPGTRRLNIYESIGEPESEAYFEYGSSAFSVSRQCDASRVANRIIVYSSIGYVTADDVTSQSQYGVMEEAISLSGVTDTTILTAFANAELAVRGLPLRFHSFVPSPSPSTPRIFRDFDVGDTVYISSRRGRLSITKQAVRLFGVTVAWPDDSSEERLVQVQTQATG